jgi:hypothetical protein
LALKKLQQATQRRESSHDDTHLLSEDSQYANHDKADSQDQSYRVGDSQYEYAKDNRYYPHPQSGYFDHYDPVPPLSDSRPQFFIFILWTKYVEVNSLSLFDFLQELATAWIPIAVAGENPSVIISQVWETGTAAIKLLELRILSHNGNWKELPELKLGKNGLPLDWARQPLD